MVRRFIFVLLLASASPGCRTCDNPYDYCGPVVDTRLHATDLRAGGAMSSDAMNAEAVPTPPGIPTPPTSAPRTNSGDPQPNDDAPPMMSGAETDSVMRSRLRYAR
jgi:hypothetical protein